MALPRMLDAAGVARSSSRRESGHREETMGDNPVNDGSVQETEAAQSIAGQSTNAVKRQSVRLNAVKHGLLTKDVVIRTGYGKEKVAEYDALHSALVTDLQPEGAVEEFLVKEMADCLWRLRRVYRSEVGEIQKQQMNERDRFPGSGEEEESDRRTSCSVESDIEDVREIKKEFQATGRLSEETLDEIKRGSSRTSHLLGEKAEKYFACINQLESEQRRAAQVNRALQAQIVEFLDRQIWDLQLLVNYLHREEALFSSYVSASLRIPTGESLERHLRYETTIKRHFYRAMDQLERLQRRRRGEAVPPPARAEISIT